MWLFSDLHALEVELWIHCFCTRLTPFKSSDCYRANLCLVWRFSVMTCFLATTFQMFSFTCPRQIISVDTWLNTVWNLDWMSVLEISLTTVSGYSSSSYRVSIIVLCLTERFPGLLFTATVCSEHQTIWRNQSVKQNLLLSGHLYGVLHHLIFCWVILYCLWCSGRDSGPFKHV